MYALRNKVQLIGHLGQKPEVKTFENGRKKAKFSMATNEIYENASGVKVKETQWHHIVAWGKLADVVEKYLNKGMEVVVEGKLVHNTYQDKEGNKRYFSEVEIKEFLMLGKSIGESEERSADLQPVQNDNGKTAA